MEMNKPNRWNGFTHWFTLICTGLMAIAAIIGCSSQGANILHWLDDMVRMPTYVREVVTRTSDAIKIFDATNQLRFDSISGMILRGDSNTLNKVECLHFQFEKMRASNDSDHAVIRAAQTVLKANQIVVMHTLDSMTTNHFQFNWTQYGLLPKENSTPK